jgi:hypothetical protein
MWVSCAQPACKTSARLGETNNWNPCACDAFFQVKVVIWKAQLFLTEPTTQVLMRISVVVRKPYWPQQITMRNELSLSNLADSALSFFSFFLHNSLVLVVNYVSPNRSCSISVSSSPFANNARDLAGAAPDDANGIKSALKHPVARIILSQSPARTRSRVRKF